MATTNLNLEPFSSYLEYYGFYLHTREVKVDDTTKTYIQFVEKMVDDSGKEWYKIIAGMFFVLVQKPNYAALYVMSEGKAEKIVERNVSQVHISHIFEVFFGTIRLIVAQLRENDASEERLASYEKLSSVLYHYRRHFEEENWVVPVCTMPLHSMDKPMHQYVMKSILQKEEQSRKELCFDSFLACFEDTQLGMHIQQEQTDNGFVVSIQPYVEDNGEKHTLGNAGFVVMNGTEFTCHFNLQEEFLVKFTTKESKYGALDLEYYSTPFEKDAGMYAAANITAVCLIVCMTKKHLREKAEQKEIYEIMLEKAEQFLRDTPLHYWNNLNSIDFPTGTKKETKPVACNTQEMQTGWKQKWKNGLGGKYGKKNTQLILNE